MKQHARRKAPTPTPDRESPGPVGVHQLPPGLVRITPASSPLEAEADRFADAFMSGSAATPASSGGHAIHRKCACEGAGCSSCSSEAVQLQRTGGGGPPSATAATEMTQLSGGESLPSSLRSGLERAAGHDLGHVRLHRDDRAARLSEQLGAEAATYGNHIVFRGGSAQDLESSEGRRLLAHEVGHTRQAPGEVRRQERSGAPTYSDLWDSNPRLAEAITSLNASVPELIRRAESVPWGRLDSRAAPRFRRRVAAFQRARSRLFESMSPEAIEGYLGAVAGILDIVYRGLRALGRREEGLQVFLEHSRNVVHDAWNIAMGARAASATEMRRQSEPRDEPPPLDEQEAGAPPGRTDCSTVRERMRLIEEGHRADSVSAGVYATQDEFRDVGRASAAVPEAWSRARGRREFEQRVAAVQADREQRRDFLRCIDPNEEPDAFARHVVPLVRLEPLQRMAAHRSRIRRRRHELLRAREEHTSPFEGVRQAAEMVVQLRSTKHRLQPTVWRLRAISSLHDDPAESWQEVLRLTSATRSDSMQRHLAAFSRSARQAAADQGLMSFAVARVGEQMADMRERQISGIDAALAAIYHQFPFFAALAPELVRGQASTAYDAPDQGLRVDYDVVDQHLSPPSDEALREQMTEAFHTLLGDVETAIRHIGAGGIRPFELPEAVTAVRETLPPEQAAALAELQADYSVIDDFSSMGLMLAEVGLAIGAIFLPVLGVAALAVGTATTARDLSDLIDRAIIGAAATTPDRSILGVRAPTDFDYLLLAVEALLTAADVPLTFRGLSAPGAARRRLPGDVAEGEIRAAGEGTRRRSAFDAEHGATETRLRDVPDSESARLARSGEVEGPIAGELLEAALDVVRRHSTAAREIAHLDADGVRYRREIDLGNDHHWRERADAPGVWCRFSPRRPSMCINLVGETRLLIVPDIRGGAFERWFDALSPQEFEEVWQRPP